MLETLDILRPTLKIEENTPTYGRLSLEPLERGYGMTLGNALRRVLLSSIRGAAITSVRIDGVLHEFSTIPGVREDVIEILMNLKHIPVRSSSKEVRVLSLDIEKAGVVTAGDIPMDSEVEFINPEAKICTMEEGAHLVMDLYVEQGTGYLSSERARPSYLTVDALLTDAIFSPVLRVNYNVEPARVGQRIDYERLCLDVWTNGIVTPDMAVGEAAQIVQTYFGHIVANIDHPNTEVTDPPSDGGGPLPDDISKLPVHELELSIRSENCLLRGGIQIIGELVQKSRDDLLKIRNLGKISLTEIEERLEGRGLKLRDKKEKTSKDKNKSKSKKKKEKENEAEIASASQTQEAQPQETQDQKEKEDKA